MAKIKSVLRITLDPAATVLASAVVVLDWMDEMPSLPSLPWSQTLQRPKYPEAAHADVIARKLNERDLAWSRILPDTLASDAQARMFAADVAHPQGRFPVSVRVLDEAAYAANPADTEANLTLSEYTTTRAAIRSIETRLLGPESATPALQLDYRLAVMAWTLTP